MHSRYEYSVHGERISEDLIDDQTSQKSCLESSFLLELSYRRLNVFRKEHGYGARPILEVIGRPIYTTDAPNNFSRFHFIKYIESEIKLL